MNLKEKFDNCEQLVAYCLKNFPETRGNDRELFLKVWDMQGFRIPQKLISLFFKVHSPETIRRTRQKIQATGLHRPDKLKVAKRSLFAMKNRDYWRKNKNV